MNLVILHNLTMKDGDWTIYVHSRHGSKDHDRRHVHITKRGLRGEYSWNEDGARHDKHGFPSNEQCISRARDLAANALNIPANTLQLITNFGGGVFIHIQDHRDVNHEKGKFSFYVHKGKAVVIFGGDKGLVVLIDHA